MTNLDTIERLSHALRTAERTRSPIAPIVGQIQPGDVDTAYLVQSHSVEHWIGAGRRIIGRKIGLTNPSVQQQLGVDQPDFGVLLDDMQYEPSDAIPITRFIQPKVEAELAFIIERDLDDADLTPERVGDAVAMVAPAIEIVDSRIRDWDITIVDTIADNASSGAFVLGPSTKPLPLVDVVNCTMQMRHTRRHGEPRLVSVGAGAQCLGSPLLAAHWLASEAARRNAPLLAGDIVLTGALGPMAVVEPGDQFAVDISGLGTVSVSFTT